METVNRKHNPKLTSNAKILRKNMTKEERNLTVLHIPNNEINSNFDGVCEYIDSFVKRQL